MITIELFGGPCDGIKYPTEGRPDKLMLQGDSEERHWYRVDMESKTAQFIESEAIDAANDD